MENKCYDIFISYRRLDEQGNISGRDQARLIAKQLQLEGYSAFFDYSEVRDDEFDKVIIPAVERCKVFILVLTRDALKRCSNDDDWVRKEIETAISSECKIVNVTPDNTFNGWPSNLPNTLAKIKKIQISDIQFGQLFELSIEKLINDRISCVIGKSVKSGSLDETQADKVKFNKKYIETNGLNASPKQHSLKIKADLDCVFYVDGEEKAKLKAGMIQKIPLAQGEYVLRFVSVENSADLEEADFFEMPDHDKIYNVHLREQRNARLKKEEEAKRKEEEKRIANARRLDEEKKRQEEKARLKVEEETKRREEEKRLAESRRLASERQLEIQRLAKERSRAKEKRKKILKTIIMVIVTPVWFPVYLVIENWREICNVLLWTIVILLFGGLMFCGWFGINPIRLLSNPKKILSKPAPLTTEVIKKENGDIEITIGDLSFLMKYVEGGTFTMGCTPKQGEDCKENELPAHQVTLDGFYMGETEVTQALWKLVMEDTRWKKLKGANPSHFEGDDHPVDNVYGSAWRFITKLNEITGSSFRLPTEAEWEYAAKGGNRSRGYKYSGSNNINEVAWYSENSDKTTHPVKTKKPNELGLYDMSGNVNEWCQDYYRKDYYGESPSINPKGPKSAEWNAHVIRGGGWRNTPVVCRVSDRDGFSFSDETFGFRLVLEQ